MLAAVNLAYTDLELGNDETLYNFIQVGGVKRDDVANENYFTFSSQGLRDAIDRAALTEEDDIIVVYTGNTKATNTLTLESEQLNININAANAGKYHYRQSRRGKTDP